MGCQRHGRERCSYSVCIREGALAPVIAAPAVAVIRPNVGSAVDPLAFQTAARAEEQADAANVKRPGRERAVKYPTRGKVGEVWDLAWEANAGELRDLAYQENRLIAAQRVVDRARTIAERARAQEARDAVRRERDAARAARSAELRAEERDCALAGCNPAGVGSWSRGAARGMHGRYNVRDYSE